MSTDRRDRQFAIIGHGTIFDGAAYWATLIGVYLMVGGLMFYSGKEKLFDSDGNAPAGIKAQFENSFLSTFPGTDTAWLILGIFEFGVFVLMLASIVRLRSGVSASTASMSSARLYFSISSRFSM